MKILKIFSMVVGLSVVLAISAAARCINSDIRRFRSGVQGQNGKVVVLAVGASWPPLSAKQAGIRCHPRKKVCGQECRSITSSRFDDAKSRNYASDEAVRKFVAANKINVGVLRDSDGAIVLKAFRLDQVPSFVIIDKTGTQAGEAFGGIDPKFDVTVPISKRIDSIL